MVIHTFLNVLMSYCEVSWSGCHVLSIASDDTYQTTLGTFESSAHLFLDCNSRQQTEELHGKRKCS